VFSRTGAITTVSDYRDKRIRIAGGQANAWRIEQLGARPVMIPWPDFPEALDNGLVDGTVTTPMTVLSGRLWERGIDQVFMDRQYYAYYVPLISGTIWRRLSEDQRAIITQAWDEVVGTGRERARQMQQEALATLAEHGVTVSRPDEQTLGETRARLMADQAALADRLGIGAAVLSRLSDREE
jgi:C4-dicarboxylate-binding protein DctP